MLSTKDLHLKEWQGMHFLFNRIFLDNIGCIWMVPSQGILTLNSFIFHMISCFILKPFSRGFILQLFYTDVRYGWFKVHWIFFLVFFGGGGGGLFFKAILLKRSSLKVLWLIARGSLGDIQSNIIFGGGGGGACTRAKLHFTFTFFFGEK